MKFIITTIIVMTIFATSEVLANEMSCQPVGKAKVANIVSGVTTGKVLSINLVKRAKPIYRVKVLMDSGRVKSMVIDACNGKILK